MTPEVIGFEGQLREDAPATWGAAAIRIGDELLNPVTRLRVSAEVASDLADEGALFLFSKPIPISESEIDHPLILIAIREKSPFRDLLLIEKNRLGAVVSRSKRNGSTCLIVRDEEGLRQYSKDVAHKVLARVLEDEAPTESSLDMVRAALVLDPFHPYLNAVRAYALSNKPSERVDRLARACTRGAKGQEAFDEFLRGLRSQEQKQELYYERGVAAGGGLDAAVVGRILNALSNIAERLKKFLHEDFSFLPPTGTPRLMAMNPGSARLQFVSGLKGQSLADRVARFFELRAIERLLQGDMPNELLADHRFDTWLNEIVHPSIETSLKYKALDAEELVPVVYETPWREEDVCEDELTALGIVTGALADRGRLEVRLFPGPRGRLLLDTDDDGRGKKPFGLSEVAKGKVSFFRLAKLHLYRTSDENGAEKFYLAGVEELGDEADVRVNAFPSSIIAGALRVSKQLDVTVERSRVTVGGQPVQRPLGTTKVRAYEWLVSYQDTCATIELLPRRKFQWARVERLPKPTSRAKLLVSLDALGGESLVNELAEEISRRFRSVMRVNNTRREIIRAPGLVEFTGEADKYARLLPEGKRWVTTYLEVGADSGLAADEQ